MTRIQDDRSREIAWAWTRFILGMAQMAAAVVSVVLLIDLGVATASLVAVVVACTLSTISVMLFGRRRGTE